MNLKQITTAALTVLTASSIIIGNSLGPPDGRTGAPGESNCTVACHSSFGGPNTGLGLLTITAPAIYSPGDTLLIQIDLSQSGKIAWGFETTVLNSANNTVGNMIITDPANTIKSNIGRKYVKHNNPSSGFLNASPGWSFKWEAPPVGAGNVTFYTAGNAANGDGFNTGDHIYTTSKVVQMNVAPVLATVGNKSTPLNTNLSFNVSATDANSTTAVLTTGALPLNATFVDNGNGTGTFSFTPDNSQQGSHMVTFTADDSRLTDSETITIFAGSCCVASTGNADGSLDDVVDIGDLTALIDNLFISLTPLLCVAEGDIASPSDSVVDISDLTALIDHLFINLTPTAPCQ